MCYEQVEITVIAQMVHLVCSWNACKSIEVLVFPFTSTSYEHVCLGTLEDDTNCRVKKIILTRILMR